MFGFLKNNFVFTHADSKQVVSGFTGESVTDEMSLETYSRDASAFRVVPKKVWYPKNTEDVVVLVVLCDKEKERDENASLTVRAGGTCLSGGPLNAGWIVDMTKYMKKIHIDPIAQTATVEMGAYFRDIEDAALEHGLMFAPYPSSHRLCGIGGMIGNNASGEKSLRHGATIDNVLELTVVLPSGEVVTMGPRSISSVDSLREKEVISLFEKYGQALQRAAGDVRKVASGYRLDKVVSGEMFNEAALFVGSQGTLGVVTQAVLKLVPVPQFLELLVISAQTLHDLGEVIELVRAYNPEGLETFDSNTFKKAEIYLKEHADRMHAYIDPNAHLFILVQLSESTKQETQAQAVRCHDALRDKGYFVRHVTTETDVASLWQIRRSSLLLIRDHNEKGYKAVPCIEDVIVPIVSLGVFLEKLGSILTRRKIEYGFHGHIGEGSFRIIPVFNFNSPSVAEDIIELMREVFVLVKEVRGNISADHSDGIIRTPFLEEFYGAELCSAFKRIKDIYDPKNSMNPKKKVGGDIAFLTQSLDRE